MNKKRIATLTKEERKELVKLYHEAMTTPMITMSVQAGIEGRDWATQAWNRVRAKMDELGKKYGYDPKAAEINKKTGEVYQK